MVHTLKGEVRFYKDEQGLPYLDLKESSEAAVMLLQQGQDPRKEPEHERAVTLVQTVRGNYEGYTKCKVLKAKEARRAQAMMGNPSEKDYKTMVSNNLIPECPITPTESHFWSRSPERARQNSTNAACASGGGLRGGTAMPSGCEQSLNVGSRHIFCRWNSITSDSGMKDQVCDSGTLASEDGAEFKQAHEASSRRVRTSRV